MTGREEGGKKRFRMKMLLLVIVTGSRSHSSSGISSLIMHIDQEKWEGSRQRGKRERNFFLYSVDKKKGTMEHS